MGEAWEWKEEGQGPVKGQAAGGTTCSFQGHSYQVQDDYLASTHFPPKEQGEAVRKSDVTIFAFWSTGPYIQYLAFTLGALDWSSFFFFFEDQ